MFEKYFTSHPRSVGESYGQHLIVASSFAGALIAAGIACFIHALIPGLFERTGSTAISRLHGRMIDNRTAQPGDDCEPSQAA